MDSAVTSIFTIAQVSEFTTTRKSNVKVRMSPNQSNCTRLSSVLSWFSKEDQLSQ
jgi:hypothetical protein